MESNAGDSVRADATVTGMTDGVTHYCPHGAARCESCGREVEGIAVVIAASPAGSLCLSACPPCAAAIGRGTPPGISLGTATRLAAQHAAHCAAADE